MKPKRSIDAATLATSPRFGFPSHGVKTSGGIHTAAATYLANRAGTPPEGSSSDEAGETAAETGRWTGNGMSGAYMAAWRKQIGQWVIDSELFVTLS